MQSKKNARKYIDPDGFYLARKRAGLTVQMAAVELGVTDRTIRNYENGSCRIPYSAFRLMRLLGGYSLCGATCLVGESWEGWSFGQNKLWTPEGRSFESYHLRYLATFISIAKSHLKTRQSTDSEHSAYGAELTLDFSRTSKAERERPSSATALFGAKVAHETPGELDTLLVSNKKAA